MTLELFLYGIVLFILAACLLMVACCAFIAGQVRGIELKPEEKPVVDEKAKKEAEKNKKLKEEADEEQAQMDEAVERFIARGGLPE